MSRADEPVRASTAGLFSVTDPDVSRTELIGATPTRLEFKPLIELRERESRLRRPGTQATRIVMAYELGLTSFRA